MIRCYLLRFFQCLEISSPFPARCLPLWEGTGSAILKLQKNKMRRFGQGAATDYLSAPCRHSILQSFHFERRNAEENAMATRSSPARSSAAFTLPDLPRARWCDFRIKYIEQHMTLRELAEEYMCDPRTVRACLIHNKSSSSLGKKTVPTRIDLCRDEIRDLLEQELPCLPDHIRSIYQLSRYLFPLLRERGYTGSERTLRNYLHLHPGAKAAFEKHASTERSSS